MRKWMILLAAVLMLLAGCGKEPAVAGLSNEEFHRYFAEDYARPMSSITEITEENGGLMLKTDLGAPITAMKDGTVAWAADVGWNYGYGKMALVQQEDCYLLCVAYRTFCIAVCGFVIHNGSANGQRLQTCRCGGCIHFGFSVFHDVFVDFLLQTGRFLLIIYTNFRHMIYSMCKVKRYYYYQ